MTQSSSTCSFTLMNGDTKTLGDYHGSVVLVVNVASACGLTPQYQGLQKLYADYAPQGLMVLGFPANNFAGQEPGNNAEISHFCTTHFAVSFPLAEKISVSGATIHPLYRHLINEHPARIVDPEGKLAGILTDKGLGPESATDIMWNFEKFLIAKDGKVVQRFAPDIAPGDPLIVSAIEAELAK